MRLGIDFGTTRTVVATVDRGNYPVLSFHGENGEDLTYYPSLIASRAGELLFGLDAAAAIQQSPALISASTTSTATASTGTASNGASKTAAQPVALLRSLKRRLGDCGPNTTVVLGDQHYNVWDLTTRFLKALHRDLRERSNLPSLKGEPLEAVIAVPANANSNQRFLTLEAFRGAGFEVLAMIDEPSAAGLEYAHHHATKSGHRRKEILAVYDLGGGTFDTACIRIEDYVQGALEHRGITQLGGDDFDHALAQLACQQAGMESLLEDESSLPLLLEECRQRKEGLHANTRKLVVDLESFGGGEALVEVEAFYAACLPLVEQTVEQVEAALEACPEAGPEDLAGLYVVGGASQLPLVPRRLREGFGRRVRRSPYPQAATAIGLAVAADDEAPWRIERTFTRNFGVWREAEGGRRMVFDTLFASGTPLPEPGHAPLILERQYRPAHTVGHFRFLECSQVNERGEPRGDLTPWEDIFFPLHPSLQEHGDLAGLQVEAMPHGAAPVVSERYACDGHGMIEVHIANLSSGYRRSYRLRQGA
ncbi:MAG: Hsp70 family protein [Acidobacteriota bacterium]